MCFLGVVQEVQDRFNAFRFGYKDTDHTKNCELSAF